MAVMLRLKVVNMVPASVLVLVTVIILVLAVGSRYMMALWKPMATKRQLASVEAVQMDMVMAAVAE